jgi:cytochrome c oxidase accessory protein FixG
MFGRVWCGWACPQTVYMEGLFRKIERLIEGPKARQIQRETGPWTARKAGLLGLKHALYLVFAFLIANIFITYFVSFEQLSHWVMGDPREHWTAFVWMAAITGIAYGNFAWFREQTCLILCPYGRLQSALTDDDSITVGYDFKRGEPRGKAGAEGVGDCVNCYRCVDVCPTGIDIREGLQLECIACANCVDACDDIMRKLKRPEGLVRYASLNGLLGNGQKVLRPRVFVYLGFIVAFGVLGLGFLGKRRPFEAVLIRQIGMPYVLDGGEIRNSYVLHLVNKTNKSGTFELNLVLPEGAKALTPVPSIQLDSLDDRRLPMVVTMPRDQYKGEFEVISRTKEVETGKVVESRLRFVGP